MFVKSAKIALFTVTNFNVDTSYRYKLTNKLILNIMKTLKSIMLGLVLLVVCGAAKATGIDAEKLTKNYAINTYIDAMSRGRLSGLKDVLAPDASFSMLRGKSVMSFNKADMLEFLQSNKNVEQACTVNTSVVESNADISIVKVDMQFDGFVRSNYVTLASTGDGWKITNVYSVFK
jgi:Putative lumazine-binding